jgi:hypothetical protein
MTPTTVLSFHDTLSADLEESPRFEKRHRPRRWAVNPAVKRALQAHRRSVEFGHRSSPAASGGFNHRFNKKPLHGVDN